MNAGTENHILLEGEEIDIVDNILYKKTKNHLKINAMNKFIALLLSFIVCCGIFSTDLFAQESSRIPDWVRKRLNEGQYAKLEEFVKNFPGGGDYNIFKRRDLDTTGLYARLSRAIENAPLGRRSNMTFSILPHNKIKSPYTTLRGEYVRNSYIIYSNIDGYDAHVILDVTCAVDETGEPEILKWETGAKSFSNIPVRFELKTDLDPIYLSRFKFNPKSNCFEGYIVGTLYFTDVYGEEHKELVSENFSIEN